MHRLGRPDQHRNVPYVVKSSGTVRCLLCGTGDFSRRIAGSHFNGSRHQACYQRVRAFEKEEEEQKQLQSRVANLGLLSWRCEVKAALYDYHIKTVPTTPYVFYALEKYERMELLSLLELAI